MNVIKHWLRVKTGIYVDEVCVGGGGEGGGWALAETTHPMVCKVTRGWRDPHINERKDSWAKQVRAKRLKAKGKVGERIFYHREQEREIKLTKVHLQFFNYWSPEIEVIHLFLASSVKGNLTIMQH